MRKTKRNSRLYSRFHGKSPSRVRRLSHTVPSEALQIGRLLEVVYEVEEPSQRAGERYSHKFGDKGKRVKFGKNKPILAVDESGRQLIVLNDKSKYRVTERGITG